MKKNKIQREKETVEEMIHIYCKWSKGDEALCPACTELLEYAKERLDRCPFGNNKSSCRKCPIHCYSPQMKQRIKEVMKVAGPRMLFVHPIMAIRHLIDEAKTPKR
ncbi:MAG: nitrous oxide-stimulated promoter family protein [Bacteroidales bacterium]|nr:nitrous oxide-stimulated promoter family protein [Bacteroidales bacterium]